MIDGSEKVHVGPILSPVAGRTDHLPIHVPSGSYVLTADVVSALGEGNTVNGFKNCDYMFGKQIAGDETPTPIVAAGGEYVISPQNILRMFGDLESGHSELDKFQVMTRQQNIKTLKNLPGPKRD